MNSICDRTASIQGTSSPSLLKRVRQLIIFILGISVLIVGVAMIVLPGPAMVVIPAGLAILATEFVWAARWLRYLKHRAQNVVEWTANSINTATTGKQECKPSTAGTSKSAS
jgi:tellurite resistance protein TerC